MSPDSGIINIITLTINLETYVYCYGYVSFSEVRENITISEQLEQLCTGATIKYLLSCYMRGRGGGLHAGSPSRSIPGYIKCLGSNVSIRVGHSTQRTPSVTRAGRKIDYGPDGSR